MENNIDMYKTYYFSYHEGHIDADDLKFCRWIDTVENQFSIVQANIC